MASALPASRESIWGFPIIDFHCHFPVPDEHPDPILASHAIAGNERMLGFAHHDAFSPDAAGELRRAVLEGGLRGYKVIAPALRGPIDHPDLHPLWQAAEELGIPVLVHFGPNKGGGTGWHENINPLRLHYVAKGFTDTSFVIPHFGCGHPRELLHLMWACRNVHVDSASFPRGLADADYDEQVRIVREMGIPAGDRALIFHDNAARLLGLS